MCGNPLGNRKKECRLSGYDIQSDEGALVLEEYQQGPIAQKHIQ